MPRRKRVQSISVIDSCSDSCPDLDDGTIPPAQRNAANARERARMRVLSKAFCRLKTTLPWVPADTKLSKLDTLRLATSYIAHLRATLSEDDESGDSSVHVDTHPLNLSWPFTFAQNSAGGGGGGGGISCTNEHNNHLMHQQESSKYNSSHIEECRSPGISSEYSTSSVDHQIENNDYFHTATHFINLYQNNNTRNYPSNVGASNSWNSSCPTH